MYDPRPTSSRWSIRFSAHDLQFDNKNRLWASSGVGGNGNGDLMGWLDLDKFEATGRRAGIARLEFVDRHNTFGLGEDGADRSRK